MSSLLGTMRRLPGHTKRTLTQAMWMGAYFTYITFNDDTMIPLIRRRSFGRRLRSICSLSDLSLLTVSKRRSQLVRPRRGIVSAGKLDIIYCYGNRGRQIDNHVTGRVPAG